MADQSWRRDEGNMGKSMVEIEQPNGSRFIFDPQFVYSIDAEVLDGGCLRITLAFIGGQSKNLGVFSQDYGEGLLEDLKGALDLALKPGCHFVIPP